MLSWLVGGIFLRGNVRRPAESFILSGAMSGDGGGNFLWGEGNFHKGVSVEDCLGWVFGSPCGITSLFVQQL